MADSKTEDNNAKVKTNDETSQRPIEQSSYSKFHDEYFDLSKDSSSFKSASDSRGKDGNSSTLLPSLSLVEDSGTKRSSAEESSAEGKANSSKSYEPADRTADGAAAGKVVADDNGSDPNKIKDTMEKNGSRVLGFQNDETKLDNINEFKSKLDDMKAAGITDLAMEGLPSDEKTQKMLKDYADARNAVKNDAENGNHDKLAEDSKARDALRQQILDKLNSNTDSSYNNEQGNAKMDLIDAAIDKGMKVSGIEPDVPGLSVGGRGPDKAGDRQGQSLLFAGLSSFPESAQADLTAFMKDPNNQELRDKLRSELGDTIPPAKGGAIPNSNDKVDEKYDEAWKNANPDLTEGEKDRFMDLLADAARAKTTLSDAKLPFADHEFEDGTFNFRDTKMAEVVDGILKKNPDSKVVIFAGSMHLSDSSPINLDQELARKGDNPVYYYNPAASNDAVPMPLPPAN